MPQDRAMATIIATEPPQQRPSPRTREHQFFWGMSLLMTLIVFIGFSRTYFLASYFHAKPLAAPIVHIHAAAFTSWMLLLLAQTSLAASGRTNIHRRLGIAGMVLAPIVFVLGVVVATEMLRRLSTAPGLDSSRIYAVALSEVTGFIVPTLWAFRLRRRSAYHKRLIIIGTIAMMTAGFGRWPVHALLHKPLPAMVCTFALLLLVIAYDLATIRKVHRATALGGAWVVCIELGAIAVSSTAEWHQLTNGLLRMGF
jgi:hypothetical protein